jgi:hypothetical protein
MAAARPIACARRRHPATTLSSQPHRRHGARHAVVITTPASSTAQALAPGQWRRPAGLSPGTARTAGRRCTNDQRGRRGTVAARAWLRRRAPGPLSPREWAPPRAPEGPARTRGVETGASTVDGAPAGLCASHDRRASGPGEPTPPLLLAGAENLGRLVRSGAPFVRLIRLFRFPSYSLAAGGTRAAMVGRFSRRGRVYDPYSTEM